MMNILQKIVMLFLLSIPVNLKAQVWTADQGDGTYRNPIIHADYSDPDVIRVGDDYYMVASSFTCQPGIPVLHSKDLVNWTIVNHVYTRLPLERYSMPQHGQGSWAPAMRYHDGKFYVYFCTPEDGLFAAYTTDPTKKWKLKHVLRVAQWEDPCPFWDEDGKAYLIRTKLCGGPAVLHRMSDDGLSILDAGKTVYYDPYKNPVLEGLKMMKRNGWYYILAPAGGWSNGWQTVLRSRDIYGPYESKKVLDQGNGIVGPHQGGLVDTKTGEWWFIHFQAKGVYGRILHLQPAVWKDDWPVIGDDPDGDGCGIPVLSYRKPNVGKNFPIINPQTSDEFDSRQLGFQWQWQAAPQDKWYSLSAQKGSIRLYAISVLEDKGNLYYAGNLLLQKFPAPEFTATAQINFSRLNVGERAGLITMGDYHTYLSIEKHSGGNSLVLYEGKNEGCGFPPVPLEQTDIIGSNIYLQVSIHADETCSYAYSTDGESFTKIGEHLKIEKGQWIGAKVGLFCINPDINDGSGSIDVDYFRIQ